MENLSDLNFSTKEELRAWAKQERLSLSDDEYNVRSTRICKQLHTVLGENSSLKIIHCFIPVIKNREPNIFPFIHTIANDFEYSIGAPISNFSEGTMNTFQLKFPLELEEKKFGIMEPPPYSKLIPAEDIDIVICPSYLIDNERHRLGYGGGFYDRYLARCKKNVLKIGISILQPYPKLIPQALITDISMDICIHP